MRCRYSVIGGAMAGNSKIYAFLFYISRTDYKKFLSIFKNIYQSKSISNV